MITFKGRSSSMAGPPPVQTTAVRHGVVNIPVSAAVRSVTGTAAGDTVTVSLQRAAQ